MNNLGLRKVKKRREEKRKEKKRKEKKRKEKKRKEKKRKIEIKIKLVPVAFFSFLLDIFFVYISNVIPFPSFPLSWKSPILFSLPLLL
jgi:cell division septal protein FtsQ